jgi:hypothetical protein
MQCTLPVKYEAKLEDGTVISKSPEEGVQFIVEEGISEVPCLTW